MIKNDISRKEFNQIFLQSWARFFVFYHAVYTVHTRIVFFSSSSIHATYIDEYDHETMAQTTRPSVRGHCMDSVDSLPRWRNFMNILG